MSKDSRRRIAYDALILVGLLLLLAFITRLWPILLLMILVIFGGAIWLLFLSLKKVEIVKPAELPREDPKPETEQDVLRRAYGLILKRVTEYVTALHPGARWIWEFPNTMARIARDEPVSILLNKAGGYRKAYVQIHNLRFIGLEFVSLSPETSTEIAQEESDEMDTNPPEKSDSLPVNYEYLAFEWVEKNLISLNERGNEEIGHGKTTLLLMASELPPIEVWKDLCKELVRGGFSDASIQENGIQLILPQ